MLRTARLHARSGKTVSENLAPRRPSIGGQRLEDHVVAALRIGRTVPGAVEGNEAAVVVARREARAGVERQVVRCPMSWKRRDGGELLRAHADRLTTVTAVLGREHELLLGLIEVALGPAVVPALAEAQQLLCRLCRLLLRLVQRREI